MKTLLALIGTLVLLAIAAFCAFGFLATFEASNNPVLNFAVRIGYAVVGLGCVAGVFALSLITGDGLRK